MHHSLIAGAAADRPATAWVTREAAWPGGQPDREAAAPPDTRGEDRR